MSHALSLITYDRDRSERNADVRGDHPGCGIPPPDGRSPSGSLPGICTISRPHRRLGSPWAQSEDLPALAFFPRGPEAQYRVLAQVMGDPTPPADRLVFPGGWQVVRQSRAALEAFDADHLLPAVQQLGDAGFLEPPHVTDLDCSICIRREPFIVTKRRAGLYAS